MKITLNRKKIHALLVLGLTGAGVLLSGTLATGASKEEVIGVITAMNPYLGFPRTLWMLKIANECIENAKEK